MKWGQGMGDEPLGRGRARGFQDLPADVPRLLGREEATRQRPAYKPLPGVHPQSRSTCDEAEGSRLAWVREEHSVQRQQTGRSGRLTVAP
mgnify:CR=1 FL=1